MLSAFGLLSRFSSLLPRPAAEFLIGTVLVRWSILLSPSQRRGAKQNFKRILEFTGRKADTAALNALLDESVRLYSRFILGMLCLEEDVAFSRSHVDLELLDSVEKLREQGHGVIIATPNFGLAAHCVWALLERGGDVTMPILNRHYLSHVHPDIFKRIITVGRSGRQAVERLQSNSALLMFSDINFLPQRRTTQFFGAPAPLNYGAAKAARATGAPILPAYCLWENGRGRFVADSPIVPQTGNGIKSLDELNRELALSMEKWLGKYPGQWQVYDNFWDIERMNSLYRLARKVA
jgi:lauroyl/myristoyl acyltransferase